ncbi:MAG: 5-formyltetrahydrofolate cyclo-ligase [Clostridia bacterium]|nr:5-formyltetrahydrofolate cyclo-ligase [Clostridia bacterium]
MYSDKKMLRKAILDVRNTLEKNEVIHKSSLIMERIISSDSYKRSNTVMCYVDFRNEVITREYIAQWIKSGKKIVVPVVCQDEKGNKELIASEIYSVEDDLEIGTYGILEPRKDKIRPVEPINIDFVIVPGVAFDIAGNRIGYGAGFYDRFLRKVRGDCVKVAVAFDFQVVDTIPVEEHDVPVDMVVTEKRVILR